MDRLYAVNRYWLLLTCLLASVYVVSASDASAQQFPYMAYVTSEQAYVRSGPGQRHYPTGQIPEGFAVEVYRHDGAGWCAIRPPERSFSWVSSHQVRPFDTGIVEVVSESVVARVGSQISPNRSAVQVLLPKGERVELIPATEDDDPRWIRIAAPAGEFRWIAADALSRQPPVEAAPLPKSSANSSESGWSRQSEHTLSEHTRTEAGGQPNAFDHLSQSANRAQTESQFDAPIKIPTSKPVPSKPETLTQMDPNAVDPNAVDVVPGSPAELQLAQFQSQAAGLSPPGLFDGSNGAAVPTMSSAQSSQPRVRFDGSLATWSHSAPVGSLDVDNVEELEVRLSQAVVQPPKQWELGPLEAAANDLLAETKSPPVRAQLREVLERIARFQEVQQRYNNLASPTLSSSVARDPIAADPFASTDANNSNSSTLTGLSSNIRARALQDLEGQAIRGGSGSRASARDAIASVNKPLYAATGLLKPVISKRAEAPQYALVDERGKVVSFVTPTPDLNLNPYVGRRIGVHGTRGFMPEYRRAHVTAGRVTLIEGTVRR